MRIFDVVREIPFILCAVVMLYNSGVNIEPCGTPEYSVLLVFRVYVGQPVREVGYFFSRNGCKQETGTQHDPES